MKIQKSIFVSIQNIKTNLILNKFVRSPLSTTMAQPLYTCQQCNNPSKLSVFTFCCYKIRCLHCQQSKSQCCDQPLSIIQSDLEYNWCSRCLIRIAKIQCQGCYGKKFCPQCSETLHNHGKFLFHIKSDLENQGTHCNKHKKVKTSSTSNSNQICITCTIENRKINENNMGKALNSIQTIQNKLKLDKKNWENMEIQLNQHWQKIQKEISTKFQQLISLIKELNQNFLGAISHKKIKHLGKIKQQSKKTDNLINQCKNIQNLQKKGNNYLNSFIYGKIKLLTTSAYQNYSITITQPIFYSQQFDKIKIMLLGIDANKIVNKQKLRHQRSNVGLSPSASLYPDKKLNTNVVKSKSPKANSAFGPNSKRSINNDQEQKSQSNQGEQNKKLISIKSDKMFRSNISAKQKSLKLSELGVKTQKISKYI